jgi:sugar phosphate isomerase/epimerase
VVAEIEVVKGCSPPGEASELCRELEDLAYGWPTSSAVGTRRRSVRTRAPWPTPLGLRRASASAAAHGLLVGVEFLPFTNIRTAAEAKELLDATDRPNAGCCVDIWHHTRGANDPDQIRALTGERVMCVQMNDGTLEPAIDDYYRDCLQSRVPPGEGEFDCVGFVQLLDGMGVTAPIAVEVCSTELWAGPADEAARRAADGMRSVLAEAGIAR